MPFTLAHPIAVLPLWHLSQRHLSQHRLDLPALIVGATIPDISYFIALYPVKNIGHSLPGILLEGVPSALLLLFIGRYLLWDAAIALLPGKRSHIPSPASAQQYAHPRSQAKTPSVFSSLACRIPPSNHYRFWPLSRLFTIVLSIIVGALTHIIWDSATHSHGWSVERVDWLSAMVGPVPLYKWLQHGGGVIGLALLWGLIIQALRRSEPQHAPFQLSVYHQGIAWLLVAVVTGLITWKAISTPPATDGTFESIIAGIIGLVSGTFVGLCLYALVFEGVRAISTRQHS